MKKCFLRYGLLLLSCVMMQANVAAQTNDGSNFYYDVTVPANAPKDMQEVKALLEQCQFCTEVKISNDTLSFFFLQYLDHTAPTDKNLLYNRCYITKFISAESPTVVHTGGYAINPGSADYYDIAKALNANMLEVEHRYAGKSYPVDGAYEAKGGILTPQNFWNYNTAIQQSTDLAYIVNTLKRLKIFTGKTIATGVSKCGMTTTFLAMHYPKVCDVYVPFCAPFCEIMRETISDYIVDGYSKKLAKYNKQDSITWDRGWLPVRDFLQNEELKKACAKKMRDIYAAKKVDLSKASDDDLALVMVREFHNSQWNKAAYFRSKNWENLIPSHKGPKDTFDKAYVDSMYRYLNASPDSIYQNMRETKQLSYARHMTRAGEEEQVTDEMIFAADHYEVQTMYELGNITINYSKVSDLLSKKQMEDLMKITNTELREPNTTIAGYLGLDLTAAVVKPVHPIAPEVRNFVKTTQVPLFFVYGEFDPWTLKGITEQDFAGNPNVSRYVVPSGLHQNELLNPNFSSDPEAGNYIVNKVKEMLTNTTAIEAIRTQPSATADDAIYDLTGRRVTTPVKNRLYIKNGKKYIHK